ncbi:MAG: methyltransferase domain-containing protein [Bacteroidetes bacterium]|nr:methyltransferase domain-containing protein [Bacteroidota bacterium]MDA0903058.1 methyltransferase domain-containing protein [Bacteroidota bacterium]MDA1241732.1 methyltransferase domain-containing protein [Bacteroidota bacterium]
MGLVSVLTRWVPRTVLQRGAHVALQGVAWAYAGSRFEDPISGKSYRRMLPYGRVHSRPNALAPHSLSLERHRAVWAYLKARTSFFEADQRLLHLAPEYCFLRKFRNMSNLDYVTGDLNSPWADHHFDCHDIPFSAESFDVVMANHLLEHVDNDRRVMAEFFRVMKPGGWGIFQVPIDYGSEDTMEDRSITDPMERERLYWQQDHVRLYGHRDYPDRLKEAGFDVEVIDMKALLGEAGYERLALHGERWVYVVKKPQ